MQAALQLVAEQEVEVYDPDGGVHVYPYFSLGLPVSQVVEILRRAPDMNNGSIGMANPECPHARLRMIAIAALQRYHSTYRLLPTHVSPWYLYTTSVISALKPLPELNL